MSLHTITRQDLRNVMADAEITGLGDAAIDEEKGSLNRVDEMIVRTCDEIAACVNTHASNMQLEYGSCQLPSCLVKTALVLIRHGVLSMMPKMEPLEGTVREAEYRHALDMMRSIREGRLAILDEEGDALHPGGVIAELGNYRDWNVMI